MDSTESNVKRVMKSTKFWKFSPNFFFQLRFGVSEKNSKRHITVFTNYRSSSLGGWCHGVAAAQVYHHYHSQRKMIFCEHLLWCLIEFGDWQKTLFSRKKKLSVTDRWKLINFEAEKTSRTPLNNYCVWLMASCLWSKGELTTEGRH